MLVLPHADGLGVDLDQLGKRSHEAAADGHRAAHRQVFMGKLGPGDLRGRIDRCAALIHHHHWNLGPQIKGPQKRFCLSAAGAVSHGDGLYLEFPAQVLGGMPRLLSPALVQQRVDGFPVQQLSLPVQADQLAARAETRVQGRHVFLTQCRGQEQLTKVAGKHSNRRLVGPLLDDVAGLGLHGGGKQPLVAVVDRQPHLL